ncbi:hypothetical protein Trco_007883 [Trichoderma cornu-damae]|uniref:YCII-related domain-containing protein n=1 Tax=Trichoderma cornu-damae TaxID=654480 RepID=A0A9P8QLA4_9HYPO|nr:hypothetical protein Trco_007883 [Trichoderma cornu-damae]
MRKLIVSKYVECWVAAAYVRLKESRFTMPQFIFLLKADAMAEAPPAELPPEIFEPMARYNEELNAAGILLAAEGLRPTSVDSFRLKYSTDDPPEVIPGPFSVTTEAHICGWWIVQTKNAEEALGWARKIPMQAGEIVVRRIGCAEELGEGFTEQLRQREADLRIQVAKRVLELAEKEAHSG